jgi:diguanylate cyclase (GGDEF)-like protein
MRRSTRPAISRTGARLLAGGLGLLLALTAIASVITSWRQAALLEDGSTATEQLGDQFAAMSMVQAQRANLRAALDHPGGAEQAEVEAAGPQILTALAALARDDRHAEAWEDIRRTQETIVDATEDYADALDHGLVSGAGSILYTRLQPHLERLDSLMQEEIERDQEAYDRRITQVEEDAAYLRFGSMVVLLVGVGALGLLLLAARERRRAAEREATRDSLTGLANRTSFQAGVRRALAAVGPTDQQPTVLMLDLDRFKEVNDTLGHHYGDLLLAQVADRLRSSLRQADLVARLGGDEFAVLLTDTEEGAAPGEAAAERITRTFAEPFQLEEVSVDIEASIGIATARDGQDATTLVRHADTAMYTAKEHGLDFIHHDPKQDDDTTTRLGLLGAMRRALDEDQLELHYQPKVSVDGGELLGAEALARWNHPTRGLVGPNEFIPALETTSLIHRFTDRVLEMSLEQVNTWMRQGLEVPVSVNVSTRSLLDERFPARVAEALVKADVPARLLCVEVTEHAVMTDPDLAVEVLRQIHDLGVRTSIDDFGTGYSSMSYLKVLPIDEIKVDRSFVMDMVSDAGNHVLVQSTVELGHNLGLSVVAEGVEDGETLAALHRLSCDVVQGYFYARPQNSADFADWVRAFSGAAPAPLHAHIS